MYVKALDIPEVSDFARNFFGRLSLKFMEKYNKSLMAKAKANRAG